LDDPRKNLALTHPQVVACILSPDGRWAVTWARPDNNAKVWDTADGKVVWEPPAGEIFAFFTQDSCWLVTSPPGDAPLRFWQLGSWRPGPILPKHTRPQVPLMPSPDGKVLLPWEAGPPRLLHAATGKELAVLEAPHDNGYTMGRFSPDGTRLAVATGNHTIHVWDLRAIRRGLAEIGLDWDQPEYPPAEPQAATPLTVIVDPGEPPKADRKPAPAPDPKR